MKRILGIVFIFSFGVLLSSCGFVQNPGGRAYDSNEASSRDELGESELAFSDTLFSVVRDRCGDCHNEVSGQAPYFAFPNDIQKSHDNILSLNLVNLSHPELSRIVNKVKDEGHQTWTGDWEADANELQSAVSSWALALGIEEEEVLTGSSRVTIPAMISDCSNSNVTTWTPMSFSLDGIVSGLTGAQFQLRICQQSDQTYRVSDYRVSTPSSIEFSGIKIHVNEIFDEAPSLNLVDNYELTILNNLVLLFPLQPNTADSLSVQEGPGVDKIHLDFDLIQIISN
ncbi:MAG: hypothetical protein ACO3LE_10905 [Bdellovibrionota bacterium]